MDQRQIYEERARDYHRLVSREDCDGNLLPAIEAIRPLKGASVVEVGAGTGRLTALMARAGARVQAVEPAADMRYEGQAQLKALGLPPGSWSLSDGTGADLPQEDESADLVIAGWVFGHLRTWHPETWRREIASCLDEMSRVLGHGGALVIIETLGTCVDAPAPPNDDLAEYYAWLEEERGMKREVISTDYAFADVGEAAELIGFFFGEARAAQVRSRGQARVPEFTGLWWTR